MRILPLFTIALTTLIGALSAHDWFTKFTDHDPRVWTGQVVTAYDLSFTVGGHALVGGAIGGLIDYLIGRSLLKRDQRVTRSSLLQLRDRDDLSEEDKQAIDLALALAQAHPAGKSRTN
jgi:hypothetical protein